MLVLTTIKLTADRSKHGNWCVYDKEADKRCCMTMNVCCRYCQRLGSTSFWGGEVELLVLSKMLHTPIYVYKTAQEGGR